eukprot:s1789_g9.t1
MLNLRKEMSEVLSMRSLAMGCRGKMIALASCHRHASVCWQQPEQERMHQGIHTVWDVQCCAYLADRTSLSIQEAAKDSGISPKC